MVKEFFEEVWNGIKRAVKFVVDVLLFIPRLIIKGVKCAIAWLEEDEDEQQVELVEKKVTEKEVNVPSSNKTESSKVVPFAATGVALGVAAAAASEPTRKDPAEATENVAKEAEKPAIEETAKPEKGEAEVAVETSTATEATENVAKEAEKPAIEETAKPEKGEAEVAVETPVTETVTEVDNDEEEKSSKTKKSTKKPPVKVEKVTAEVVDTKTGEVITPVEVFGNSDKKASQYENAFIRYYNDAAKKYGKNLWSDGALELQKFARSFLDAVAIKEGITPLKGAAADKRYMDLLTKVNSKVSFSENEKEKLTICLGCQNRIGTEAIKPQMDVAFNLVDMYQSHYYEAWYKASQQGNPAVAM